MDAEGRWNLADPYRISEKQPRFPKEANRKDSGARSLADPVRLVTFPPQSEGGDGLQIGRDVSHNGQVRRGRASFAAGAMSLALTSMLHAEEPPPRYALVPRRAPVLPYDEDKPIPLGYHVESHPRQGMIIGGFITFTLSYTLFALPAAGSEGDARLLIIPFAGPFLFMHHEHDVCLHQVCDMEGAMDLYFWLSGIGQIVGAGLVTIGYTSPRQTLAPGIAEPASEPSAFKITLAPAIAGRQGVGLGAVGTF
jgi:hypothetical protein